MKYNSLNVASTIAKICKKYNYSFNNTIINKLLYCAYGCVLEHYNKRLCEEYPKAYQYGPVFPKVLWYIHNKKDLLELDSIPDEPKGLLNFIEYVVKTFGKFSANQLSKWSRSKKSPWYKAINTYDGGIGCFIPDDLIKDYFIENIVYYEK